METERRRRQLSRLQAHRQSNADGRDSMGSASVGTGFGPGGEDSSDGEVRKLISASGKIFTNAYLCTLVANSDRFVRLSVSLSAALCIVLKRCKIGL